MADFPMGGYRWLTVVSPDGIDGMELVLEPMSSEPAGIFQKSMYDAAMPTTAFITFGIGAE